MLNLLIDKCTPGLAPFFHRFVQDLCLMAQKHIFMKPYQMITFRHAMHLAQSVMKPL